MTKYNTVRWEKTQFQADKWHNEAITKADASMKIVMKKFLNRLVSEITIISNCREGEQSCWSLRV